ncbi:MAG: amino acid transporter [Candidatus Edwardsbacteria bacterium RIFOXYD12_FULL_50_11]|uniref:Amino acid transporter n=1 Tax=Candidatus Edwardsbacteria bacterium GWF2_54_11 TaxID=1817851 RepID=A0A1F5RGT6_9BACT|nr:MAG: amino acid transporter [Candidatus Edwardsbacteria bacterium RifOxyC12_full_54_24]OGF08508.1 MAG: amino acid transporter [Candidatus Edwardsbacteria bacterium RifOxyA12_full_54_48]OGF11428.1 MAG: amino acid transporter [Candidatus Edwardsbacteria bacterium GWE2_54_12]OGF13363.1 MAG: amino acid transporter [Candidatus Edwardsbacteria bacterium GWF2_54_11]OGF16461.1 MAG: amino acid transporter [Candidatus Edwardsbacteria bacterium RIFOXYD12_FULL_50_11]OGJ17967.1 MAG: amino acid transport
MAFTESEFLSNLWKKLNKVLIGGPKNVEDPRIFHKISLVALLAWIGLGADGLSSSSYGPEEAFRALGSHTYLAIFLALATALTVFIISYSYSKIIEHFPHGGGGYIVTTSTLGSRVGVVSGSALLVDYVLTITVSIAACSAALFSFLPMSYHVYKIPFCVVLILALVILNLRGVKESVIMLAPIFGVFLITHLVMIGYGISSHLFDFGPIVSNLSANVQADMKAMGLMGIMAIFVRAYSLGAGTYTGIEAVSNGLLVMREPRVQTGKRTMFLMATSLAFVAGGLFLCYMLLNVHPVPGRTLNAVVAGMLFGHWPLGNLLALVTILSEGALLFVAAQTGFIDGPRVMSSMAVDSWLPHRFASLSERLTMNNGVIMMGTASLGLLFYTGGDISVLVIMYSINVFLDFSLSQLGMTRYMIVNRRHMPHWKRQAAVFATGLILCLTILIIAVYEKFAEGGWITLVITFVIVVACYRIRNHYDTVRRGVRKLDELLLEIPTEGTPNMDPPDKKKTTAVILVDGYNGYGVHLLLNTIRNFPRFYHNYIFASAAIVDTGSFKGAEAIDALRESTEESLRKYVDLARRFGLPSDYRMEVGTEAVETASLLCQQLASEYYRTTVFTGKLIFHKESLFQRVLHNETAYAIQRRLQWEGITTVVLPIRTSL